MNNQELQAELERLRKEVEQLKLKLNDASGVKQERKKNTINDC